MKIGNPSIFSGNPKYPLKIIKTYLAKTPKDTPGFPTTVHLLLHITNFEFSSHKTKTLNMVCFYSNG